MQHSRGPEVPDLGSPASRSRSRSITSLSSDSQISRLRFVTPPSANPAPSFIAPTAASQIVTADQEFNAADFVGDEEEDDTNASALVTAEALSALNGFLDHLLFNILATAKSTQLSSIRPAVSDVLKPRLAKEVVSVADEELSEYLGGPDDEQIEFRGSQAQTGEFDLIRSWKLTRLRCMVYTRLGDMEEDDEEEYIKQEGLGEDEDSPRRFTSQVGNITPAAAIFLTSIIEHLGEQALVIAGETARSRLSTKLVDEDSESAEANQERGSMNRLIVEDLDMEKLALNPTLGRLWRTWRKRTRTPNLSRMASRESIIRRGTIGHIPHSRKSSVSLTDEFLSQSTSSPPPPVNRKREEMDPASIPLPINENDVREIENPSFTSDAEGGEIQTMEAVVAHKVRPRSLMVLTLPSPKSPSSSTSSPITPKARSTPATRHARSRSLPSTSSPPEDLVVEQFVDRTSPSSEEGNQLETMYEHEEEEVEVTGKEPLEEQLQPLVETAEPPQEPNASPESDKSQPDVRREEATENSTAHETRAQSSLSVASVDPAASSRSSTTTVSSTILIDRDPEIIEGQGMCVKASLTSVQRPTRISSRDSTHKDDQSIKPEQIINDRMVETLVEDPSQPQSEEISTPIVGRYAKYSGTCTPSSESQTHEVPSMDSAVDHQPRPVFTSSESARSEISRTYSKPAPLPLTNSLQHRQGVSVSSAATERAAVQRISGRPSTSVASSTYSKSRRSDSFSSHREKRPVTAGSNTSQVSSKLKGLIIRPNDSNSLLRSSSETSRVSGNTGDSMFDDKSGLDELIRSEETIHYTLTPKSVREMEFPDSPLRKTQRSNTADLAEFLKHTGPEDPAWPVRTSTTSSRGTGDFQYGSKPRSPDLPKHSPVQSARMTNQRPKMGQARDARPSLESSSDLAHFIRSSGPEAPSSPTSGPKHLVKSPPARRFSDTMEFAMSKPSGSESVISSSSRNARLQARPAVVPKGELTSDLIDFIREGPPTIGAHRIPRTVAPFRSTMDSDELTFGRSDLTTPSVTSTQDELTATKSQVSLGSRTGLLESSNRANVQVTSTRPLTTSHTMDSFDDPRPQRKQRRVRDPYAIDFSDDDGEFEELLQEPRKPQREEESLIDFLRNVPPPGSASLSQPRPFVLGNPPARTAPAGFGSASSMKARLLRNTSFERAPSSKSSKSSLRQHDQYFNGSSNYAVKAGVDRHAGTMNTLPSVAERRQTETSALAEFLRNTGPPEPPSRPPAATKDTSFSRRLFVRRKKVEV